MSKKSTKEVTIIHTDEEAARIALAKFLRSGCQERWFEFRSPEPDPVDNCLCWHEYKTLTGTISASIRYPLLAAMFAQPFSYPKILALRLFGARIHRSAYLSPQVFIDPLFPSLLTIEEGALVGLGVRIAMHEHAGNRFRAGRVRIGRGATIGAETIIAAGVHIGEYAQIALGSVVHRDVPPHTVALGNPARIVRRDSSSDV